MKLILIVLIVLVGAVLASGRILLGDPDQEFIFNTEGLFNDLWAHAARWDVDPEIYDERCLGNHKTGEVTCMNKLHPSIDCHGPFCSPKYNHPTRVECKSNDSREIICQGDFDYFKDADEIEGYISCQRALSKEDPMVHGRSCFFTFSPQFSWASEKTPPFTIDSPDMLTIPVKIER